MKTLQLKILAILPIAYLTLFGLKFLKGEKEPMLMTDLSLKYLVSEPKIQGNPAPTVLFLHGRGANEGDLFDLAPKLDPAFRVIAPRAPIIFGLNSFGWFHTSYDSKRTAIYDPKDVYEAREILTRFIREVKTKYHTPADQLFLFGFSQGAMLSLGVLLKTPNEVGAVAALSGWLLPEFVPVPGFKLDKFPVLMSHGTLDEVLPVEWGRRAKAIVEKTGADLRYSEYHMGHDVTDLNFDPVVKFLDKRIGK